MNLRVGFLTSLLLLSFVAASAPHAFAQSAACSGASQVCQTTTQVTITPPTTPIKPLGPFVALPITIVYTYVPTSVSLAASQIQLSVTQFPPWAVATVSPSTVYAPVDFAPSGGQPVQRTLNSFLLVSATQDAPAFTQGVIEVQAASQGNGNLQQSTGSVQVPVQADFFSIIEATTPNAIQKAKPQALVSYPVTVTNFGNAQTKVEFLPEGVPEKWQVTPPSPVTLQARQQGQQQNSRTVNLNVQTPFQNGYMNVVGAITMRIRSSYALDPKVIGDSTIISTLTTTKGFYVPGFDPMLALMGIGAVAVALANRPEGPGRRDRKQR
jgi:hypothetical protein